MIMNYRMYLCLLIISIFYLLVLYLTSKKKVFSVILVIASIFLILNCILLAYSKQVNPIIRDVFTIILFAVTMNLWLISLKENKKIIFIVILNMMCIIGLLIMPGVKITNYNNETYIGLYDKPIGLSETWVYYYKTESFIIIDTDYSFIENYGFIQSGDTDLNNKKPYEIYYNKD